MQIGSVKARSDPRYGTRVQVSLAERPTRSSPAKCWDSFHSRSGSPTTSCRIPSDASRQAAEPGTANATSSGSRVLIPGDGRIADADVTVEFLALDPSQGAVRLDAKRAFSCTAPRGASRSGRTSVQVPLGAATAASVAETTSAALGRLADALATQAERTLAG